MTEEWRVMSGEGGTPPPCFLQEFDSMGVSWWGSANDVILKGDSSGHRVHGGQRWREAAIEIAED